MANLDAYVEAIAHHCSKNELDQAVALLEKDIIPKHPRAWAPIIESYKGNCSKFTMILAVVGGLRASQIAGDDAAQTQVIELFELMVAKAKPNALREPGWAGFRSLMHGYLSIARQRRSFRHAMGVLRTAISVFQPMPDHLTPFHAAYVQLCLLSENPRAALPLLEVPVFEVDPATTGSKAVDFMAYFYYGGVVFTALRDIPRARVWFRNVLAAPAAALSQCMLLAFKCLTLLNVVAEPKPIVLPPHLEHRIERSLRALAKPYTDLATALESRDDAAVSQILTQERQTFENDDLVGLVNQAVAAAPRLAILNLTRVYVTLTLTQISAELQMPEATVEKVLASMIARDELDASIDKATGNVSFGQGKVPSIVEIQRDIARATEVNARVADIDDRIVVSKPHVMAKLRAAPNLRELLHDYDQKRKANRSLGETIADAVRNV
eukprot:CAMPEP_0174832510 /NCGR_PEP_ID=MMETSP1114-20130205/3711_1 /TAXON_ID=312471 /ORGANISM="Neobodo designis, Strain CCAP 1951/1" /LENGTH=438 /DNA_ID=CAMNT_0016066369 /DNA_START=48 /DNA_END=1364 /DNA_ORIENTATION=+